MFEDDLGCRDEQKFCESLVLHVFHVSKLVRGVSCMIVHCPRPRHEMETRTARLGMKNFGEPQSHIARMRLYYSLQGLSRIRGLKLEQ